MGDERIPLDELKALALIALLEIAEEADHRPHGRTYALRFLLAWLFAQSDGNRIPFDRFWRDAVGDLSRYGGDHQQAYMRGTSLRGAVEGMSKCVGVDFFAAVSGKYVSRRSAAQEHEWEASRIAALEADPDNPKLQMIVAGIRERQAERQARRDVRRSVWGEPGPENI